MKKKSWPFLSYLLVILLFLAGCSGNTNGTNGSTTSKSETGGNKILTVAQNADAVTLDPHKTNDLSSANPMQQIYNTLVDLTPDMEVVPSLATEWKQIDDLTWEFKLREGVKFHNGQELKASDVKFTYDRLLNPETAAPGAFMLAPVQEVKIVDDYTIQIVTKEKFAPIIYNLTHVATSILNEAAVKEAGDDYGIKPVGTGPFKFVNWEKASNIEFERFEDYFEGPAKLEKVVFRVIPESATSVAELQTGGVDVVLDLPPQHTKQFEKHPNVEIVQDPSFAVKYLSFDMRQKPFDNPKVHQAINYAVNKENIIKAAYQGAAVPANGPLAPGINGAKEELPEYKYDPEKAKQLLEEAGFPNGFETTLYLSDADIDNKIATILQSQLKEVGINVNLQVMEWGAFLDKTAEGVPMFILSWITVTGDADNGMYALFHSKNAGGSGNRTFYGNPAVDGLLDQARSEINPETRVDFYHQAQEQIVSDAPWAFIAVSENIIGVNKRVKGFVNMPTQNYKFYPVSVE